MFSVLDFHYWMGDSETAKEFQMKEFGRETWRADLTADEIEAFVRRTYIEPAKRSDLNPFRVKQVCEQVFVTPVNGKPWTEVQRRIITLTHELVEKEIIG